MGRRRTVADSRRDAEFAAFTAGAGGRLLHTATLLTGDPAAAERLLTTVLARVYADWFRMRADDPYEQARSELVRRFHHRPWWKRPRGGELDSLSGQERLVVTLRYFEGVAEEQTAAQLGLPADRVRAICSRATATLRSRPARPAARSVTEARAAAAGRGERTGAGPGASAPAAAPPSGTGAADAPPPGADRDPAVAAPGGSHRYEGTP
ncbi:Sigma-70, region 4 [Actinacidiphila rubida]|uniref:Sigma-70, region 4 n=1 Tax=Actinacidiphila rubida TaxID=310780 RepID=A0A1H8TH23_9ACTN|nr:sigma factor-like helix-turn-helix DNA-binding protein [Actinacidiphila rubida]SEO90115.1 Sigma-70, region 4 [Actinacidiphila rubida]